MCCIKNQVKVHIFHIYFTDTLYPLPLTFTSIIINIINIIFIIIGKKSVC